MAALLALALGLTAAHVAPGPGSGAFVLAAAGEPRRVAFLAPSLPDGPVAVNTADAEELDTLPGVGEVIAGASWRNARKTDPFTTRKT